ncbi:MAG: hypothetical protein JXR56_09225 [Candidatus Cloacimonetes bacterium]|nr:hypothetical protein [Candidatus Cloacimonadota bacterium]
MKQLTFILIVVTMLLGCGHEAKRTKSKPMPPRKVLSADIPLWFYDIPQSHTTGIGIGVTEEMAKEKAARQIALFEQGHVVCNFCEYDNERDKLGLQLKKMEFKFSELVDSVRYNEILNSIKLLDSINLRGDFIGLYSTQDLDVPFGKETVTENDLPPWHDRKEQIESGSSGIVAYGEGRSHTIWSAFEKAYQDALYKFSRYLSTGVESYISEKNEYIERNATAIESDIIIKNVKLEKLFVIPSATSTGLQQYKVFCQISWNNQQEVKSVN